MSNPQLEKELTYEKFVEWTRPDMMDEVEVQVGLPQFKMEENYDMKTILVSMGMVDAFDVSKCDFSGRTGSPHISKICIPALQGGIMYYTCLLSLFPFTGMSPANDLVLSKVVHKAFIEVNEEGTEAAAATAAIMMLRCALLPATFIADHPFLFFIRHNSTMSVLFVGRYCSPQ